MIYISFRITLEGMTWTLSKTFFVMLSYVPGAHRYKLLNESFTSSNKKIVTFLTPWYSHDDKY